MFRPIILLILLTLTTSLTEAKFQAFVGRHSINPHALCITLLSNKNIPGIRNITTGRHPEYLNENFYFLKKYYSEDLRGLKDKVFLDVGAGTTEIARYLYEDYGITNARQLDWWYSGDINYLSLLNTTSIAHLDIPDFLKLNAKYLISGTAQNIPLPDASVDLITSAHVFRHFEHMDLVTGVLEMHRVLKPGGRIIITPLSRGFLTLVRRLQVRALRERGINIRMESALNEYWWEGSQVAYIIEKPE